jgi:hypothetical protein
MTRSRRHMFGSSSLMISDYPRRRRRVLVVRRGRDSARKAPLKRKPVVRVQIKNTPFKDRDKASLASDVSSGRLNKILDTMRRRQCGGKLILQLPRNRTTRKIPYSAWLDMLDDLRLWDVQSLGIVSTCCQTYRCHKVSCGSKRGQLGQSDMAIEEISDCSRIQVQHSF